MTTRINIKSASTRTLRVKGIGSFHHLPDAAGVFQVGQANIGFTPEGGVAFKLTNRSGVASVKGLAVNFHASYDNAYAIATDPYVVVGFIYQDGVADGSECWVVRDGIAEVMLEDGQTSAPDEWVKLSTTVAGRVITQDRPGLDFWPSAVTYNGGNGTTISGGVASLGLDDGVKLVIGGSTGAPSIDARVAFSGVTLTPNQLVVNGYFAANRAAGVTVSIWDYVAGGGSWVQVDTFPASGTTDVTIISPAITANMISNGEMLVRLHGADAGTTNDRLHIDKLIFRSTEDVEHFKELGHTMTTVAAGTDILARVNLHFL